MFQRFYQGVSVIGFSHAALRSYWYGVNREKCEKYDNKDDGRKWLYQIWGKKRRRRGIIVIVRGMRIPWRRG